MKPLFEKLLRLLAKNDSVPLEDYITEIFANCLEQDTLLRKNFLTKLDLKDRDYTSFYIDTQCVYIMEGKRTDLEINLGHTYIMVESKIGSEESQNQLVSYAKILAQKGQEYKLLVFLTAKREDKELIFLEGIQFQQLRWHDVALCIDNNCNAVSQELKNFLRARKLIMENINYSDVVTFQSFFDMRRKFNDILQNDVSQLYTKKDLFSYFIYQPTVRDNEYVLVYNYGREVNVALGFGKWWGEHPCLFTRLWISHKKDRSGNIVRGFQEKLSNAGWYLIDTDPSGYSVEYNKPLIDFLQLEDNQRASIVNFFQKCIEDLGTIIPNNKAIFNLPEKPLTAETLETTEPST